jgi:hypothetical protein
MDRISRSPDLWSGGGVLTAAYRSVTATSLQQADPLLRSCAVVGRLTVWRGVLLVTAVLLAGCGGASLSARTTGSRGLAPGGYLAQSRGWVDFLEFTLTGTSLTGSLDAATLQGATVGHQHYAFSGVINGASITLTIPAGLGFQTSVSGEWQGSTITLSVPQQDGTLASVDFTPADTSKYNAAVDALQGQAQAAQQQQAEASASAAAAEQQQAADNALSSLAQTVSRDIAQLQSIGLDGDLTAAQHDLANEQKDVGAMRSDEQKTAAESDPSMRCGDASMVQGDASMIEGDVSEVEGDQSSLNGDIASANNSTSKASDDLTKLQSAENDDPSYSGSVPSADDVNAAVGAVRKLISQATSAMDGDVAQAKSTASSAQSEATSFDAKYCTS